jgi:bacteriorhodopsin
MLNSIRILFHIFTLVSWVLSNFSKNKISKDKSNQVVFTRENYARFSNEYLIVWKSHPYLWFLTPSILHFLKMVTFVDVYVWLFHFLKCLVSCFFFWSLTHTMEKMKIIFFCCDALYTRDGHEYKPFRDLRFVPKAIRLRE